jgi:iron complex transport system substrate-binding protein
MHRTVALFGVVVLVAFAPAAGLAATPQDAPQPALDCTYPVTLDDATGTAVTVDEEPERVVTLLPSAAQTMWAIGAEDKVVGLPVNQYTAYLDGREGKTDISGDGVGPVREKVVGANPDLVLAPNATDPATVSALRSDGLTVYYYHEATSLAAVPNKTERTGQLVGAPEAAARQAAATRGTVDAVETAVADESRPRVYYSLGGQFTAGANTFIHDVIVTAGGENVAAEANVSGYAPLNQEIVAQQDPEWIVLPEGFSVPDGAGFNNSTAVREDQVVTVNDNFMNQPGPRVTQPLGRLAETFHPETYDPAAVADPTTPAPETCAAAMTTDMATATESATSGMDETPTTTEMDETPASGTTSVTGPGFTVLLAIVAVLAAALVTALRRRA